MIRNFRWLIAGLGLGGLVALHGIWLPWVAAPLIADQPDPEAGVLCILGGDQRYAYPTRGRQVLLFPGGDSWVCRVGAVEPSHLVALRQLKRCGVPAEQVELLPIEPRTLWDAADQLADWMEEHQALPVGVLTSRFHSREARHVLERTLPASAAARLRVMGLPDRRYDERSWWRSRDGWKAVFQAYLSLAFAVCSGRPGPPRETWDPDVYEQHLRAQLAATDRERS